MERVIPWHVFLAEMNRQPRAVWNDWLCAWRFGEEGVCLRVEIAEKLQPGKHALRPTASGRQLETMH